MSRGALEPMWLAGVGVRSFRSTASGSQQRPRRRLGPSAAAALGSPASLRLQLRFHGPRSGWRSSRPPEDSWRRSWERHRIPRDLLSVDAAVANYQTGKGPLHRCSGRIDSTTTRDAPPAW